MKMNYLASPPLVIAYSLAGTMDFDFDNDALGKDSSGNDVYLKDIWPTPEEVQKTIDESISSDMFTKQYSSVFEGDHRWKSLPTPKAPYSTGTRSQPMSAKRLTLMASK